MYDKITKIPPKARCMKNSGVVKILASANPQIDDDDT